MLTSGLRGAQVSERGSVDLPCAAPGRGGRRAGGKASTRDSLVDDEEDALGTQLSPWAGGEGIAPLVSRSPV